MRRNTRIQIRACRDAESRDSTRAIDEAVSDAFSAQRRDGGWADLETLESGAFATGQTLVALATARVPASHPAYQRGVGFLLDTQLEDGSWFVRTRALGFQPYFDNGFPHGLSQWISGAATSWATMALSLTSDEVVGEE